MYRYDSDQLVQLHEHISCFQLLFFLAEILAEKDFQSILASACTDRDGEGWDLDWVVRYSAIKKCRGIIAAKGFICKGSRDIKKRK